MGEELGEVEDVDAMIARLAAHFGIDESELRSDEEETELEQVEGEAEVRTDLFGTEGGVS